MYLVDPGLPDRSDQSDFRKRVSQRLGHLSKMCDDPLPSAVTVSTCAPEDFDMWSPASSIMKMSPACSPIAANSHSSPAFRLNSPNIDAHKDMQLMLPPSPPSPMVRAISSPSLGHPCESPLQSPYDAPSRRDLALVSTPPRTRPSWKNMITPPKTQQPFWQQQLVDASGNLSAERKCRAAAAKLDRDKKYAANRLGAADPYVESLRMQAGDLRKRADQLQWDRLVHWHERNVARAMRAVEDGADIAEMEAAVRLAYCSELGPGHWIVDEGKRYILRVRKQRRLEELAQIEGQQQRQLEEALELGDFSILAGVIESAADTIGSAHRSVEAARGAMKEQRKEIQESRWGSLVNEHEVLMLQACATNNIDVISARVYATATSELGVGHPIVDHGKECIRDLKRQAHRAQQDFYRQECVLMLNAPEISDAINASDLATVNDQMPW